MGVILHVVATVLGTATMIAVGVYLALHVLVAVEVKIIEKLEFTREFLAFARSRYAARRTRAASDPPKKPSA